MGLVINTKTRKPGKQCANKNGLKGEKKRNSPEDRRER